ncbi:hypothetical protein [Paenibacillus amylolyticus]|uniref:hypothetical protein n=1 Tax=Paenibacillus amylolyticus TaxID=1451 RepID=UPI00339A62C4
MSISTQDFIEALRSEIKQELRDEIDYFVQRGQFFCRQIDLDQYVKLKMIRRK